MLELGFKPMVFYALQTLEQGGVRDVVLVAAGERAAAQFADWVKGRGSHSSNFQLNLRHPFCGVLSLTKGSETHQTTQLKSE